MCTVFSKEEEVLEKAQEILEAGLLETKKDEVLYTDLVQEFKNLLDQMKRVVKMSDRIEAKLSSARRAIEEISKIDFLTNIYNRRFFNELLISELKSCARNKCFLSVLMLDVDKFKSYNDTYGHLMGDKCLQLISEVLKNTIHRPRDIVARYGGEEFVVLMPETDLEGAKNVAENIRSAIEKLEILHEGSPSYGVVTVSIGVAAIMPEEKSSPENLMAIADEALYRAKKGGKNRVNI